MPFSVTIMQSSRFWKRGRISFPLLSNISFPLLSNSVSPSCSKRAMTLSVALTVITIHRRNVAAATTDEQALNLFFGNEYTQNNVHAVLGHSRNMSLPDRHQYLRNRVLPGSNHSTFRLRISFAPSQLALVIADDGVSNQNQLPGNSNMASPAIDLIGASAEPGVLQELRLDVQPAPINSDRVEEEAQPELIPQGSDE